MDIDIRWSLLLPTASVASCFFTRKNDNAKQSFKSQQQGVALGMAMAAGCTIVSFLLTNKTFKIKNLKTFDSPLDIVVNSVAPWFTFQAASLGWGIVRIATKRFFSEKSIDGGQTSEVEMDSRYLNNTLEQVVLSLIGNITATSFIIGDYYNHNNNNNNNGLDNINLKKLNGNLCWIILNCNMFFAGRILFWYYYVNYPNKAGKRSLGFALTFYPSVATIIYSFFRLIKMQLY